MISLIVLITTCAGMIASILWFPKIKIGKCQIDLYWLITLLGAVVSIMLTQTSLSIIGSALMANNAINPIKILILFISMTFISVFLDEVGFFTYLANVTLKHAKTSQTKLFLLLYLTVSVLTVFTSNDVIILSFTPFICYFAKNAKINAIPYLACEFVAANTWSMALMIGNPTNVYLSTAYGVTFLEYVKVMALPTLGGGLAAMILLFLMFRRHLQAPLQNEAQPYVIQDKIQLIIGLAHLVVCTVFLAIASYIHVEMYMVSGIAALSLMTCAVVIALIRKKTPIEIGHSLKRAPWQLIPFVISMFTLILVLNEEGMTAKMTSLLGEGTMTLFTYGYSSFFAANLINNIPMSVLFCSIIAPLSEAYVKGALYATVIGSNIGAFMTPIGALAGIMWSSLIEKHGMKFGYRDFLKLGVIIAIPTITVSLLLLFLVV